MNRIWLVIGVLLLFAWAQSALYSVDQAEFGYVTRFGDPTFTHDGKDDAGLHLKLPWPIDSVQRVDRRLQVFDLPPTETLTRDKLGRTVDKTIAVDAFVCWKIPDAKSADRFIRTVGTPEQARRLLTPRITGRLAAVISNLPSLSETSPAKLAAETTTSATPPNQLFDPMIDFIFDPLTNRVRIRSPLSDCGST